MNAVNNTRDSLSKKCTADKRAKCTFQIDT